MKEWNPHVFPAGGWAYPLDGLTLRGTDLNSLAITVFRYHQERGRSFSQAEVYTQIVDYLCHRQPDACRDTDQAQRVPAAPDTYYHAASFATDFRARQASGNVNLVGADIAEARAKICSNCPYNGGYNGSCRGCEQELTIFVNHLGGRIPGFHSELQACSHYKAPAALLAVSLLSRDGNAPKVCWRNPANSG